MTECERIVEKAVERIVVIAEDMRIDDVTGKVNDRDLAAVRKVIKEAIQFATERISASIEAWSE